MEKKKNNWLLHLIVALVIITLVGFTFWRLWMWNNSGKKELDYVEPGTYDYESLDYVFSVEPEIIKEHTAKFGDDGINDILCIGDYVLTLTSKSGNTIINELSRVKDSRINCLCVGESSVADVQNAYGTNNVTDWQAGNLYDVVWALCNKDYALQKSSLDNGHGILQAYYDNLIETDLDYVDTVFIMYSSVDYIKASNLYDPDDKYNTATYEGALRAAISTLQTSYPHLKVVVGSPYLHGVVHDEDYIPATMMNYGNGNLSEFVMRAYNIAMECCVSFEDNYFGLINEETIADYCDVNVLNDEGLKLIGNHMIKFFEQKY